MIWEESIAYIRGNFIAISSKKEVKTEKKTNIIENINILED